MRKTHLMYMLEDASNMSIRELLESMTPHQLHNHALTTWGIDVNVASIVRWRKTLGIQPTMLREGVQSM